MLDHWFWGLLTLAVLVWYSTVVIYVAIKGAADIKHMLARLGRANDESSNTPAHDLIPPADRRNEER